MYLLTRVNFKKLNYIEYFYNMDLALSLFDRAIKKGAEIFLLHEELKDKKEAERRFNVCKSNAGRCYNEKRDKCNHCKCYMSVKTGMLKHKNPSKGGRIEITHCPIANWGKALSQEAYEGEKEIANYYRQIDGKKLLT